LGVRHLMDFDAGLRGNGGPKVPRYFAHFRKFSDVGFSGGAVRRGSVVLGRSAAFELFAVSDEINEVAQFAMH